MVAYMEKYAEEHPERIICPETGVEDERHKDAVACNYFGLAEFFEIMDEYDIGYKSDQEYQW